MTASSGPDHGPAEGDAAGGGIEPSGSARGRARASRGRRIRGLEPEERRQERRRQLLDSALELFATQGYARTSIEQICQGAYVGFKGFYDEFATKEALFLALYDELVERISTNVAAVAEHVGLDYAIVRELLEVFVRSVLDDPRVAQVLFVEAAGLSPAVEAARRATYRTFAEFLQAIWMGSPLMPRLAPEVELDNHRLPLAMVGAIVELMVDWLVDGDRGDTATLVDDLEIFCGVMLAGVATTWPAELEGKA